jgi:hypothetical protein
LYKDSYDLELSCANEAALQAFLAGSEVSKGFDAPGITELTEATKQDDEFALAHAALARQLQIHGFANEAKVHSAKSVLLQANATVREQSAIAVAAAAASFNSAALGMARRHVDEYPQDLFVLSYLVGPFGLLAFSGEHDWRAQSMTLLQETKTAYPADDWWHLTARSYAGAEIGELDQARKNGERAWALRETGNCAHSLAHVHFEAGVLDEGAAFINDWDRTHGGTSDMRHHLLWHLALLGREGGAGPEKLMDMYERELDADISDPMPLTTFSDNAALLWRCKLAGIDVPEKLGHDLLRYADKHYPDCGFGFADIHRVMSVALLNDHEQRQDLVDKLGCLAQERDTELDRCMLQFAKGFNAFADADYASAVKILEPVLPASVLLGGSNPQRRVVEETFQAARQRASQ